MIELFTSATPNGWKVSIVLEVIGPDRGLYAPRRRDGEPARPRSPASRSRAISHQDFRGDDHGERLMPVYLRAVARTARSVFSGDREGERRPDLRPPHAANAGARDDGVDAARRARLRVRQALFVVVLLTGCAATQPLEPMDRPVDLARFMGDWYVQAHIPIDLPFFSEAEAYNGVESYRLTTDGTIETTYRFRAGSFDGPEVVLTPRGWVHEDKTAAEWRMQFLWPFRSAYLIVALDDDYRTTIVGVPSRRYAWIMSRAPVVSDIELRELETELARLGYDLGKLRRMPQRWPTRETPPAASAAQ